MCIDHAYSFMVRQILSVTTLSKCTLTTFCAIVLIYVYILIFMKICMPGLHAMVMLTKDEVDLQSLLSALPPTQTHILPLRSLPCALRVIVYS